MLPHLLQPPTTEGHDYQEYQYGRQLLYFDGSNEKDVLHASIALLYLPETASESEKDHTTTFDPVRRELGKLRANFKRGSIVDLGTVKGGLVGLTEILEILLQHKVLPVILSGHPHALSAQLGAYERSGELLNAALVDSHLDFDWQNPKSNLPLNEAVLRHPEQLFRLNCMGHQSYFIDPMVLNFLDQKHFDAYRLGHLRANFQEAEPIVRDADLLSFNLSSIRSADAPATQFANPNGFRADEACRLVRYAAMNDRLTSLFLGGYNGQIADRDQTARLIAQMFWYIADGFFNRKGEYPLLPQQLTKYIVNFKENDYPLVFFKSTKSERWWLWLSNVGKNSKYDKLRLISCSYADYQRACGGELPERLLNAYNRWG